MSRLSSLLLTIGLGVQTMPLATSSSVALEQRLDPRSVTSRVLDNNRYTTLHYKSGREDVKVDLFDRDNNGIGTGDSIAVEMTRVINSTAYIISYKAEILDDQINEAWHIHTPYENGRAREWNFYNELAGNKAMTSIAISVAKFQGVNTTYLALLRGETTPGLVSAKQRWDRRCERALKKVTISTPMIVYSS